MRTITRSPVTTVPTLLEKDITNNIVIVVQIIPPETYLCICEKLHNRYCRTVIGVTNGNTVWSGFVEPTLIGLLIKEYKSFHDICDRIVILESRQDVDKFIKDYSISNNSILGRLFSKSFKQ